MRSVSMADVLRPQQLEDVLADADVVQDEVREVLGRPRRAAGDGGGVNANNSVACATTKASKPPCCFLTFFMSWGFALPNSEPSLDTNSKRDDIAR